MNSDIETSGIQATRELRGLEKVCKAFGRMKCGDVMMVWDYALDIAVSETEMPEGSDRWKTSEKAKYIRRSEFRLSPDVQSTNAHGEKTKLLVGAAQQEKE